MSAAIRHPWAKREVTPLKNGDATNAQQFWERYSGPNLAYIQEQYERYEQDPDSVDPSFRELFRQRGAPPMPSASAEARVQASAVPAPAQAGRAAELPIEWLKKVSAAGKLVLNIRSYGHLSADIDPLGLSAAAETRLLQPETYGLSSEDLAAMPASLLWNNAPPEVTNGLEAIEKLRELYTQTTAYDFAHVNDERERVWLFQYVESGKTRPNLQPQEKQHLLKRLIETEQFEVFLHRTFVGQKRFSVEGNDVLIPMLDEIVHAVGKAGGQNVLMGMAHRGRLNVLAHVLGKPYSKIFSEFHHSPNKELVPSEGSIGINFGWTGDVKYHLGADRQVKQEGERTIRVTLANNPSHLEFVNPVVEGFTRAAQEDRSRPGYPKQDVEKAAGVLIHGDAAFAGEGIVAETLNFNQLTGYRNGGTIHIIVNNRLGFTTESRDSRSTYYASDLAKGYEIPVVHVNADDPEACIMAVRMAIEYRSTFKKDFLIDLIGYRRFGHNESDDPETTQPLMYAKVRTHPTVATLYAARLAKEGVVTEEQAERMKQETVERLKAAYEEMKQAETVSGKAIEKRSAQAAAERTASIETAVPLQLLKEINAKLLEWPEGFHVYPKLKRILERRAEALEEGGKVDWALAETLAFATILADGKPIRMTGQDSERGTFAHRHLVLHDYETGETYCPLHRIPQAKASFAIHNSPLSEASVLGFEYGYNVFAPETLVIWEAQYGDFANAAQVIFDQFISAGQMKWRQKSSLVVLLPHGYEGQGPEHSSARLERFLQMAGENNWTVVNMTRSSQYFHLLRRQAALTESNEARPLIVMAPKSLIRNARVSAPAQELSSGAFRPLLEQPGLGTDRSRVSRLILCSGKVAIDLEEALEAAAGEDWSWLHIVRIEQLYPFPEEELRAVVARYPNLREIVWTQEEPRNMGAWFYMEPRLREILDGRAAVRYAGRPERSSPASGYQDVHAYEQKKVIADALGQNMPEFNEARRVRT